jgi:hypothetical protein
MDKLKLYFLSKIHTSNLVSSLQVNRTSPLHKQSLLSCPCGFLSVNDLQLKHLKKKLITTLHTQNSPVTALHNEHLSQLQHLTSLERNIPVWSTWSFQMHFLLFCKLHCNYKHKGMVDIDDKQKIHYIFSCLLH